MGKKSIIKTILTSEGITKITNSIINILAKYRKTIKFIFFDFEYLFLYTVIQSGDSFNKNNGDVVKQRIMASKYQ